MTCIISSTPCHYGEVKLLLLMHICTSKLGHALLTHFPLVTHVCVSKLIIIGSDNGSSPVRRQAIIRTICWNIVNWKRRNKFQWNQMRNSYIFSQEDACENVVWKLAAILSWPDELMWLIGTCSVLDPRLYTEQILIWCQLSYTKKLKAKFKSCLESH